MKKGMPGGMQQLMKKANQMQTRMKKLQEEFSTREFEGSSGGGSLKVKVDGDNLIKAIEVSDDVFQSGDKEMLEELILTATNQAIKAAKDAYNQEMEAVSGGLSMPGMF